MSARGTRASLARLMERYVAGDRDAYRSLFLCVEPRVRRQIRARTGDIRELDDLTQVVFLRAHAARRSYEQRVAGDDDALVAWFCAIARNTAINFLRGSYRERLQFGADAERSLADAQDDAGDPEMAIVGRVALEERRARVRDAIERLPQRQREVVRLHKLEGVPLAEVARRLGVRDVAVRVRAHRAYENLRHWLAAPLLDLRDRPRPIRVLGDHQGAVDEVADPERHLDTGCVRHRPERYLLAIDDVRAASKRAGSRQSHTKRAAA
jgi:RNA polymerase sigma-70 factor, ECF subfamily